MHNLFSIFIWYIYFSVFVWLGATKKLMPIFTRPGPQVCLSPPQKPGPLGTLWIPWTFRYPLDSLDLSYPLDTLDLQVPFGYLGPLGTLWIPWIFMYLLNSLDIQVPFGYLGPFGTFWVPWTFRYLLDTLGPLGTF